MWFCHSSEALARSSASRLDIFVAPSRASSTSWANTLSLVFSSRAAAFLASAQTRPAASISAAARWKSGLSVRHLFHAFGQRDAEGALAAGQHLERPHRDDVA